MRGESPLWSVAMITAVVALIAVSVVAVWVAQRGGHIDVADEALAGVGNSARAWGAAAASGAMGLEGDAGAGDSGVPESAVDAGAEPLDAGGDDASAAEADAGDDEEEEVEPDAGLADAAAPVAKQPAKKKKPIKKPRRR